ncbi:MAG TPA: phytoene/squalene synthase family protein [Stellaceae bacterium]|nr:phytoene/squalene synthase family protein [Stellaceae bacterium]
MTAETRKGSSRSEATESGSTLAALLRRYDRDRFQTALFAPAERREALLALYAFNYEIARVRETVTEPMLGQIRLQWWREVVAAAFSCEPQRSHLVALPLTAAIRGFGLTRAHFDRLIDTRERDLVDEPPGDLTALEDYAEGTSGPLVQLALEVLGVRRPDAAETAWQVGIGYALAGLLRAMPFHARAGRCFIPEEIADRVGFDPGDYAAWRGTPAIRAAVRDIAEAAFRHLRASRDRRATIPRSGLAAVLPALVADRFLGRLRRADHDPFAPGLAAPDGWQSWRLAAAALFNRF